MGATQTGRLYEVECRLQIETRNHSLQAKALRVIEQRARATGVLGTRLFTLLLVPEGAGQYRLVVRGTTVPGLLQRVLCRTVLCGWARSGGRDAQTEGDEEDESSDEGSDRRSSRARGSESGPFVLESWGGMGSQTVFVRKGSEDWAVEDSMVRRDLRSRESCLVLALSPAPATHPQLVVAGAVCPDRSLGEGFASFPLPVDPEEQAAILGLVRLAPASLPCRVQQNEFRSKPIQILDGDRPLSARLGRLIQGSWGPNDLARALADSSPIVRLKAVEILLDKGLLDPRETKRTSNRRSPRLRTLLAAASGDPDPGVALAAIKGAVSHGIPLEAARLTPHVFSPFPTLAAAALEASMVAHTRATDSLALVVLKDQTRLISALSLIRSTKFTPASLLLTRLSENTRISGGTRLVALDTVVKLAPTDRARQLLIRLSQDPDASVRTEANRILKRSGTP